MNASFVIGVWVFVFASLLSWALGLGLRPAQALPDVFDATYPEMQTDIRKAYQSGLSARAESRKEQGWQARQKEIAARLHEDSLRQIQSRVEDTPKSDSGTMRSSRVPSESPRVIAIVYNHDSGKPLALIRLRNRTMTFTEGQEIAGLKVVRIEERAVHTLYYGKKMIMQVNR